MLLFNGSGLLSRHKMVTITMQSYFIRFVRHLGTPRAKLILCCHVMLGTEPKAAGISFLNSYQLCNRDTLLWLWEWRELSYQRQLLFPPHLLLTRGQQDVTGNLVPAIKSPPQWILKRRPEWRARSTDMKTNQMWRRRQRIIFKCIEHRYQTNLYVLQELQPNSSKLRWRRSWTFGKRITQNIRSKLN